MSDYYGHHMGVAAVCWDGSWVNPRILLERRTKDPGRGFLVLPGGTLEKEGAREGLQRELVEEIGTEARALEFLTFNSDLVSQDHPIQMVYFMALVDPDKVVNVEPDKCEELIWVDLGYPIWRSEAMWDGDRDALRVATENFRRLATPLEQAASVLEWNSRLASK
jgi:8-oxo-dGTP pyrophosphatase MutT (NUDIX family)